MLSEDEIQRFLISCRESHSPYLYCVVLIALTTGARQGEILNLEWHDMRHTFATLAASNGASNLELATAMGHRTLQMLQRYTHLNAEVTKKYSNRISERILKSEEGVQTSYNHQDRSTS